MSALVSMPVMVFGDMEGEEDEQALGTSHHKSMYVSMFEEMLDCVLNYEIYLFSREEIDIFQRYRDLSGESSYSRPIRHDRALKPEEEGAKYLFIRLALRKSGAWFRLSSIETKYGGELGASALKAMEELWQETWMEGPKVGVAEPIVSQHSLRFARSDEEATIAELLDCLSRDELKKLAKKHNIVRAEMTMPQIKGALLAHTSSQTVLPFSLIPKTSKQHLQSTNADVSSTRLLKRRRTVEDERLRQQILAVTTRCIQVDGLARRLLNRLNLVYLRCTNAAEAEALLLPCVLNRAKRRSYPDYNFVRTSTIFPTREDLLLYEEAMQAEASLDVLQDSRAETVKPSSKSTAVPEHPRIARATQSRRIWEMHWNKWKSMVDNHGQMIRAHGLERFESGHILARIMYKGAEALAYLAEHELEIEVLQSLLGQTRWRRGKRGAWWERLALVYMNHLDGSDANYEKAKSFIIEGLGDPYTHIKYKPCLEKRLKRLETKLKVAKAERHKCHEKQRRAQETVVEGVRVWMQVKGPGHDGTRQVLQDLKLPNREDCEDPVTLKRTESKLKEVELAWKKGKSVWQGRDGKDVTVEQLALEYYEDRGYKGFHAEGRIIAHLFSLLLWDILFLPVPGAFETPYQTAPLDLLEDAFFPSRQKEIEGRLSDIAFGKGPEILQIVDGRERSRNTWCLGVRWDLYTLADLMEIADCIGGKTLAALCRLLAEDYSLGTAGVPDLLVWNSDKKTSKFVEVKGPGDTLSENQRVWIDLLLRINMDVELCKVVEEGTAKPTATRKARRPAPCEVEVIAVSSDDDAGAPKVSSAKDCIASQKRPASPVPSVASDAHGFAVFNHQVKKGRKKVRRDKVSYD